LDQIAVIGVRIEKTRLAAVVAQITWHSARKIDMQRPYADWTTEALLAFEEQLYDDEASGDDTWFIRDQVLWELNYRDFGKIDV
jgi:hypothetical protein